MYYGNVYTYVYIYIYINIYIYIYTDSSGTAQHYLASTICSLFALQIALHKHSETLRKCLPKRTPPTSDLFSLILPINDRNNSGFTVLYKNKSQNTVGIICMFIFFPYAVLAGLHYLCGE
jgi:hypothetical protein